ncbi:Serine/threonine protein kinase [Gracilaria domingensis]|nr:Serine/threonine protein kinase [Gracilaria domingensis]
MASKRFQMRLGKYVLQEEIGAGGFGKVRRGFDESTGEKVAIKILNKDDLCMHEMTQCVKKEIELLTTLRHPNIIKGKEVMISKHKVFLVMEYADGGDVHSALQRRRRFTEGEARVLFRALMEALIYCHSKGVYHRDLKLENMLLTSSGGMKVCDFGLASVRDLHKNKTDLCSTIVGTEDFSCPEIRQSIPYKGEKADMWSCGVILFSLLAGRFPFEGNTPKELSQRVINCKYSIPRYFSKEVKEVIQSLLVKEPKRRRSAREVLESDWLRVDSPRSVVNHKPMKSPNSSCAQLRGSTSKASTASYHSADDGERSRKSWRNFNLATVVPVRISVLKVSRKFTKNNSISRRTEYSHNEDLESFSIFDALGRARVPNFVEILKLMRDDERGIQVEDRKWRLRTFRTCFIGQEMVQWICDNLSRSTEDAVALAQGIHEVGTFHHVCRDHGFKNDYLFYRWIWDDAGYKNVLNTRYTSRSSFSPDAGRTVFDALSELLNICRFHQQLHDYRQIDMLGLQQDARFTTFSNSVVELQTTALNLMESDEQRICFLVNLYNMFWIHARIHIGDFEEMDFRKMKRIAEGLEYVIDGTKISLLHVTSLLLSVDDQKGQRPHGRSESRNTDGLTTAIIRNVWNAEHAHNDITPSRVNPLVMFLMSDSSPLSPAINAVTEGDLTQGELQKAAGRYIDKVVEVDLRKSTVRYPVRVGDLRRRLAIGDDLEMVELLWKLSAGFEIRDDLDGLKNVLQRGTRPLAVVEVTDELLPFSKTMFAPDIVSEWNDVS